MSGEHHGDGQASHSGRHRFRSSTSTAWTRAAFAAIVLVLSFVASVAAGPYEEDAATASLAVITGKFGGMAKKPRQNPGWKCNH